MNWLFFNITEWIDYFETTTDGLLAGSPGFDGVVGGGVSGAYADINAAIAALPAGSRIQVLTHPALTDAIGSQTIDKDDIYMEFAPTAVIDQTETLTEGLIIDAERVTVVRPRFTNWDNAGGDRGLQLTANARNCFVKMARFFNSTDGYENLGTNNDIEAIEEA